MTPSEDGRRTDHVILTPASMDSEPLRSLTCKYSEDRTCKNDRIPGASELYKLQSATDALASHGKYERLSRFLHNSLPSREDMERICKANRHPSVLAHEILTLPYPILEQNSLKSPESLLEIPEPDVHPVLISRYMLQLAIYLLHLHPDIHEGIKGLSESPRAIMERLVDLATGLVTTNDDLLGSIEGLQCVMLETMYQANGGNLRRSWVASRRAMGIAQLMGLNRSDNRTQYKVLDPKTEYHPHVMWFRIIFLDQHLCLMLGLPQGSLDRSIASEAMLAKDSPMGRLERIQCGIASRILERNESNMSFHDMALTRTLDVEMQRAARSLPSKWWLIPSLDVTSTKSQGLFWDMQRLFAQILHYNILNQLHLPYMLRSSSAERKYEYSRITCVNASREVLSRFIALRSFDRIAYSCRIVDFLALMAAMTLLLAHLESHRSSGEENLLAHQYLSDRAMIERAQENMKEVSRLNSDALSAQSADLLRRLLAIEVETADGYSRRAGTVSVEEAGAETSLPDQDDDGVVSVHIPYFGIIKIAREGVSKEVPKPQATTTANYQAQSQVPDRSSTTSTETFHAGPRMCPSGIAGPGGIPNVDDIIPVDTGYGHAEVPSMVSQEAPNTYAKTPVQLGEPPTPSTGDGATHFAPQLQNGVCDLLLHHGDYPGLTAGGEDWAFQGVDMAFFDSLMKRAGNEGNQDAEWTT
ncbi:hypothetical protein G7Z17_g13453 [Cylindrodendrum hubeiense]|uniref:Xylanolytic transcriptional activator regulatory domain-containing protein n=1 Tax=Cylindrodendrum hubeiense TaxID=595255 RepID=A0A9P5H0Z9_9HYPO|nr:hypothetical protein G7Z17_g13453 [Cylindrodendrum hubeiense]